VLKPGSKFGNYNILSLIGEGAQGTVYRAVDTRLEREVALKVIRSELADSKESRTILADEAKKTAQIDSPFVVKVWEYEVINGQPYISYEFVTGADFRKHASHLTFDDKLKLTTKIAEGIAAIHAKGVIHRDLKPENIRITPAGDPKIFDFGLATAEHGRTVNASGEIEGTIAYASPEQLSGEPISCRSDLFSYGVILYELFTGRLPFDGEHTAMVMYSLLYEEPLGPQEIAPSLPAWLSDLIVHLLKKQPQDRPQSITDVIDAINRNVFAAQPGTVAVDISKRSRTVTVVDLKNLSDDKSWDYFCVGFTEDVVRELTRRTDLIVSAEPSTSLPRNINDIFDKCRSDFVLTGSLMKWQDKTRLSLAVYGDRGRRIISNRKYESTSDKLFDLLSTAATDAAVALAEATGTSTIEAGVAVAPDVTAYDFYLRGRNYYRTNRPDDQRFAEEMYRKALEIDPRFALAHTGLADVYAFQYMTYYERTPEKIAAAKAEAEKALRIEPQLPEAYRSLGRYYMLTGDNDRAEEALLKAVEFNPKYAEGYRTLAWLKSMEGKLSEGLTWAKKALQLAPTDLETLLLISLIQMDSGKFTVALATLQRAIELGPDYGRAYHNLGTVYLKLGVPERALENFLQATRYKGDPNAWHEAGYVYLILKDYESAKAQFREAVDTGHLPFISLFYLGMVAQLEDNLPQATEYFHQCLGAIDRHDRGPEPDVNLMAYRAMTHAALGQANDAVRILEQIATRKLHGGEIHYCMARAYAILGDGEKARECLKESFEHTDGATLKEAMLDPFLTGITAQF
jgi:serine/threonine protein kinase/Tfp pilus assembly protein PilF